MSIFDNLNAQQGMTNPQEALQRLRANPADVLKQAGMNIPAGMNDPQQIINHLVQSGQVSNPRLQMAQKMLSMIGRR